MNESKLQTISKFLRSDLSRELIALYSVQAATTLLPVLTIPYLARILGAEEWGAYAYFQSFALYGGLMIEYGFAMSATRTLARNRDSLEARKELLSGVFGAKALLTAAFTGLTLVTALLLPINRTHPELIGLAWLASVSQGFNFIWFFQGIAKLRFFAFVDVSMRLVTTIGVFVFVHSPKDVVWALCLFASGICGSTLVSGLLAYRGIPFVLPTFRQARTHLAEGLSLFLGRTAVSLYTTANGFILGLFVSPIFVGYFAAAERINRGVLVLQGPLAQTMYSHINHVMAKDPDAAKKIQRINFLVTVGTASVIGLMLFLAAPYLVPTLLGKQFVPAIRALQVMCLLSPLVAAATSLGAHILLPHGFDKAYTKIVILAAVINFSVAAILAPHYKHVGMCVAVVISEIAVSGGSFLFLVRKGLNPFARQSSDSQAKGIGIFPVPARSKS